ncbi:MAG: DUF2752 domain-containing protein [Chitinophagaceae bacterium]|nr:DUF2752 domain-containing protein [Chitinophagaceae bacterium]
MKIVSYKNKELLFWTIALVFLYFLPFGNDPVLCPIKLAGLSFCPGCGIGSAIHLVLHLNLGDSIQAHYLGIPATIVILYRTITLYCKLLNSNSNVSRYPSPSGSLPS